MKTNYVLIDFENVVPENVELLDQEWIKVLLFVGKNQTKIPFKVVRAIQQLGNRAEYVEMSGTGHNALDFHIAYFIGKLAAADKGSYFHIVSNDQGFDPLITYLKAADKVFCDRVPNLESIPALVKTKMAEKTPAERVAYAKDRLLTSKQSRARTRKTLMSQVSTMFMKALSEVDLAAVVDGLIEDGCVRENGKRIEYSDEK